MTGNPTMPPPQKLLTVWRTKGTQNVWLTLLCFLSFLDFGLVNPELFENWNLPIFWLSSASLLHNNHWLQDVGLTSKKRKKTNSLVSPYRGTLVPSWELHLHEVTQTQLPPKDPSPKTIQLEVRSFNREILQGHNSGCRPIFSATPATTHSVPKLSVIL